MTRPAIAASPDAPATLPHLADGHDLAQRIAQLLAEGPALVLVSGCDTATSSMFLDGLGEALASAGRVVKLGLQNTPQGNLFERIATQLNLDSTNTSAPALAAQLGQANTFILYATEEQSHPEDFEQLRQLNNVQPQGGHLSIVLCGPRNLEHLLPGALRQRINAAYRLNVNGKNSGQLLRRLTWVAGLAALASLTVLVYDKAPKASVTAKPALNSSLKVGPVLATPEPATAENPRSHIFQTEAEAEAALQIQEAGESPAQE